MAGIAEAVDTVDALAKDPQRLRQVLHDCRQKQDAATDPLCIAASKAWRARFFGPAKALGQPVPPAGAHPDDARRTSPSPASP